MQTPAALEPTLGCPWPAGPLARLLHAGEATESAEPADTPPEWRHPELPAVWQARLASFELALSPACPPARAAALIDDWVRQESAGRPRRWEPETLSRRVTTWSKLFLRPDWRERVQPEWRESLYEQARWLERHLERASTGTALLTNAKALLFAGASLPGPLPERWVRRGLSLVEALAEIQVLPDGGQRDRSPMRHCQVTEDLLDVVNLLHTGLIDGGRDVRLHLAATAGQMIDFLVDVALPDHQIPLFNDSTGAVAAEPLVLVGYAGRVLGHQPCGSLPCLSVRSRPVSGYYALRRGADMLVVDCGPSGTEDGVGHPHCDLLSYELVLGGRRVVVDSGVRDFGEDAAREYARSTRAHNTVVVDGEDQSGRCGLLGIDHVARPVRAALLRIDAERARFDGTHDGYRRLPGDVLHRRIIHFDPQWGWEVQDWLEGGGTHRMESLVHLHPDLRVSPHGRHLELHGADGVHVATVVPGEGVDIDVGSGAWFPEMGRGEANAVLTFSRAGELPLGLVYRIAAP